MKNAPISCSQVFLQPPVLIIPKPNATGVPLQTAFEVTYNGDIGLWSAPVLMTSNGGTAVTGSPFTIVPTPGPIIYGSQIPTLQAATSYTVDLTTPPSGGTCSETVSLGTFTTR